MLATLCPLWYILRDGLMYRNIVLCWYIHHIVLYCSISTILIHRNIDICQQHIDQWVYYYYDIRSVVLWKLLILSKLFFHTHSRPTRYSAINQSITGFIYDVLNSKSVTAIIQRRWVAAVRRCGVVGSTLTFGSIGRGFESEHRFFSHHSASAFSKLRSLAKCSLDDSVRRLL